MQFKVGVCVSIFKKAVMGGLDLEYEIQFEPIALRVVCHQGVITCKATRHTSIALNSIRDGSCLSNL